jgi:YD repeat-containing protein
VAAQAAIEEGRMVAIFTGAGAGFERGSGAMLGAAGLLGSAWQGRSDEEILVNAANGNLMVRARDEFLIGRGPDAAVTRTYNSIGDITDDGDNWRQGTNRRIFDLTGTANTAGSTVKRVSADGSIILYSWDTTKAAYIATDGAGAYDKLVYASSAWTWTDGDTQWTEYYTASGTGHWRIANQKDTDGNTLAFTYDGAGNVDKVTTADGGWIQYTWASGRITQMATGGTAAGTTRTRYSYHANGKLQTVTVDLSPGDNSIVDNATYWTTYGYDAAGRVNLVTQKDGSQLAIAYDASGRVQTLTQTVASGVTRVTSFAYNTNFTTITDASGQVARLDYSAGTNWLTKITAPPAQTGAAAQVREFGYNGNGDVTSVKDASGNSTLFGNFTAWGRAGTVTDRLNNIVDRSWGAKNELLTETRRGSNDQSDDAAHTTRHAYDGEHHLRFTVSAEGYVTEYRYAATGALTDVIEYPEHLYGAGTAAISETDLVNWRNALTDRSSTKFTTHVYDARGALADTYHYAVANADGTPSTAQGYDRVHYVYDQAGRLISRYTLGQNTETFVYDGLNRLVASTDLHGGTTSVVFDDAQTRTVVTLANGLVKTSTYNKAGDLVSYTDSGDHVTADSAQYKYDQLGRPRQIIQAVDANPANNVNVYFLYDKVGRKIADINHNGWIAEYRYDANDRLIATTRYATALTAAQIASLQDPNSNIQIASIRPAANAGDLWTWRIYDKEDRVLQTIEGDGSTTVHAYDKSGRLVRSTAYFNKLTASLATFKSTPPTTVQLPAAHAKDSVTRTFFDRDGRILGVLDGEGFLSRVAYDKAGQKVDEVAYLNATTADANFRATATLAALTASITPHANDRRVRFAYDGSGLLRYRIDAFNQVVEFVYDSARQATAAIAYAGSIAATADYTVDNVRALVTSSGLAGSVDTRRSWSVYDAAGRLAYAIDAENAVTRLVYDNLGQVIRTIRYAVLRATTSLPTLATMDSWASGQAGNAQNRVTRDYYNDRGELRFQVDALGYATRYDYDAKGQRIGSSRWATAIAVSDASTIDNVAAAVNGSAVTSVTQYDVEGRVSATYDGEGKHVSYIYYRNGLLEAEVSMLGTGEESRTRYEYDAAGRITKSSAAWNTTIQADTSFTYDGHGNRLSRTDPDNYTTSWTYDRLGRVLTETNALSGVVQSEYDAFGNVVRTIDARNKSSYFYYDKLDRLIAQRDAENYVSEFGYTAFSQTASVTRRYLQATNPVAQLPAPAAHAKDAMSFRYYDRVGRLVEAADAEKYKTTTGYNSFGEVIEVKRFYNAATNTPSATVRPTVAAHAKDAATKFEYDRLGRQVKAIDAETATVGGTDYYYEEYTLDAYGNRTAVRNRLGGITSYVHDKRGLILEEIKTVSADYGAGFGTVNSTITDKFEYDARGNRTKTIEGFGTAIQRTTTLVYDKLDRLIERRGTQVYVGYSPPTPYTPTEYFKYDKRGNLIETIDANGARALFYYDALGRQVATLAQVDYTTGAYSRLDYDANGNVLAEHRYGTMVTLPAAAGGAAPAAPSGEVRTTSYEYDGLNRRTKSSIAGQRIGYRNASGSYVSSIGPIETFFTYDSASNLIKTTDPNGNELFVYFDKLGRKVGQVDQERYLTSWTLDAGGNVLTERRYATQAASATTAAPPSVTPNAADRVTNFAYDRLGRRLTEERTGVVAWTVNAQGALTAAATSSVVSYSYNALGQVARKVEATGDATDYAYDNAGRLVVERRAGFVEHNGATAIRPTMRYYYDALDSLTSTREGRETASSDDRITSYGYALGGRLSSVTDAAGGVREYVYDPAGRLVGEHYLRDTGTNGVWREGITYTHDALGRLIRLGINYITEGDWNEVHYTQTAYNAFGEIAQRGTNDVWQEQFAYDGVGRLIKSNSGDGVWRHYVYDAAGNQTMAIESEGMDLSNKSQLDAIVQAFADTVNATIKVYDKRGQETKSIQAQRELSVGGARQDLVTERGYNAFGEVSWEKDAIGNQTDYSYNAMGRRTQSQLPAVTVIGESGASSSVRPTERLYYDLSGRLVGTEDANSVQVNANRVATRQLLAGTGYGGSEALVAREWHLDNGTVTQGFDVFGDLRRRTDQLNRITYLHYDKLSHLTQLTHPGGLAEYYSYDILGQQTGHWNGVVGYSGREITEYDALGRITRQVAFGGDVTTISRSWMSSLQASGLAGVASPVPGGWQVTTSYANGKSLVESTDAFGHVVSRTDLGNHTTSFGYDRAGRMITRTSGGETINYDYLNIGVVGQVVIGVDTSASQTPFTQDRTSFTYDKNGNRLTEQFTRKTGQMVDHGYWVYENWHGYWDQYWVSDWQYETSDTTISSQSASYDAIDRLTGWSATATATTPAAGITYYYDANSNIRRSVASFHTLDQNGTASSSATTQDYWYRYDLMNRVVTAKGILSGSAIVRGTQGVDLLYNAAGERVRATSTTTAYATVWDPNGYDPNAYGGWGGYTGADVTVEYSADNREDYTYWADGQLKDVHVAQGGYTDNGNGTVTPTPPPTTGSRKANYWYDSLGRLERHIDWGTDPDYDPNALNQAIYDRRLEYNAKGQVTFEQVFHRQGTITQATDTTNNYGSGATYALGALVSSTTNAWRTGVPFSTSGVSNSYAWYDGAAIASATVSGTTSGTTTYNYNGFGQLISASVADGRPRTVTFTNDMNGQAIRRDEYDNNWSLGDPHEVWYRFGARQMGYTGNNGTLDTDYMASVASRPLTPGNGAFRNGASYGAAHADFDQFYNPVTSYNQGGSGGSYTVRSGETLASIAAELWGDAGLWYKLAEANGLGANATLVEGQRLTIPAGVMRSSQNASTFEPYDAAKVLGDTSPTTPTPQAQTQANAKKNKCGILGMILLVVVAVAITAIIKVPVTKFFTGMFVGKAAVGTAAYVAGTIAGGVVGGAVTGAIASAGSQLFGLATGIQQKFNWGAVATSAIAAGIGGGLDAQFDKVVDGVTKTTSVFGEMGIGGGGFFADVARGALTNALTQGVSVAVGLQKRFDFAGVAAAGIGAGVGGAVARTVGYNPDLKGFDFVNSAKGAVTGMAASVADAAARSLIDGSDFGDNILASLPDVIAQFAFSLGRGAIEQPGIEAKADEILREVPNGGDPEQRERVIGALARGETPERIRNHLLDDSGEIVVTAFRIRPPDLLPYRPVGFPVIGREGANLSFANLFFINGPDDASLLTLGLGSENPLLLDANAGMGGPRFVTEATLGNDAHLQLTMKANSLGPPWFANVPIAPDGTKFYQNGYSYIRGFPDLGNTSNRFIWELKPEWDIRAAHRQVYDYSLSTVPLFSGQKPKYIPGLTAPSFFTGNKYTTTGNYGWIDYTFWGHGVITYRYTLLEEYVRVPLPFDVPLVIPVPRRFKRIGPIPVPVF